MKIRSKPKLLLLISLGLIALVFLVASTVAYEQYSSDFLKNERANQQKMTRIVTQSMNRYFETLRLLVESIVLNPEFSPDGTEAEDRIRYKKVSAQSATQLMKQGDISKILTGPRMAKEPTNETMGTEVENWKIFKALPEKDSKGNLIAKKRRTIVRNVLRAYKDIHYAFEMDTNGDLVFLEPYETQKNVTSFNYEFRDYLRLVKSTRATALSEGYISHDQERTQIITVATPIFDNSNRVAKLFAVSVSASTLRERVFRALKENMDVSDGTVFYLVDRHGHIVASSTGKNIYFPTEGSAEDEKDLGNLRSTGFFKTIDWGPDVLEKGNIWERNTKSWLVSSLRTDISGQYKNLNGVDVFATFFPTPITGSETTNWGILVETPIQQLLASQEHLKNVFYLSGIFLLIVLALISMMILRHFGRLENQVEQKEKEVDQIASQVAHDILSPLAALDMVMVNLQQFPEDKRLIVRGAVRRIKDIANNLLSKKKVSIESVDSYPGAETRPCSLLSGMIDEVISEKRIQYRSKLGVEIEFKMEESAYGLFANVQPIDFKRMISNILNNSIEAIGSTGKVEITLSSHNDEAVITIKDNGVGVPPDVVPTLMQRGKSFGKSSGNGLGLYHARKAVEAWNGKIELKSELGKGTVVTIKLPKGETPVWFVSRLEIPSESVVVVLDDDTSIHQIWNDRFTCVKVSENGIRVLHFSTPQELEAWTCRNRGQKVLYLIDHEFLGHETNGLDVIDKLGVQNDSILVTSRFDDIVIKHRCKDLQVRMIPKSLAGFVPIVIGESQAAEARRKTDLTLPDLVLIDDELLNHAVWNDVARDLGLTLLAVTDDSELTLSEISKVTPIYIDKNLKNQKSGLDVAKKLHELGFNNLFITTGEYLENVPKLSFVNGIIGKEFPILHLRERGRREVLA